MSLWLIGAGPMAQDYAKVLQALETPFAVIGRGSESANVFSQTTGIPVLTGGLEQGLREKPCPDSAIVAVGVEQLARTASALIQAGTRRILLEKPGGLDGREIQNLNQLAGDHSAEVWLAYNRRFYASTLKAEEIIAEDGGAASVQFEFTEWAHVIRELRIPPMVKERIFFANSTHVVDLVFHLCGVPRDWRCWSSGSLDWHPAAARFCGAGVTNRGILFSYLADWDAPGRWGIEILTRRHRLIFRPMEQLQIMTRGSIKIEPVEIGDRLDHEFKPGLFLQIKSFLSKDMKRFCKLEDQLNHARLYSTMAGYQG